MQLVAVVLLSACLGTLSGCTWIPSSWSLTKTPLQKLEQKQDQRTEARERLLKGVQASAHKTAAALEEPASERRDEVASDFARETVVSIDQIVGTPVVGDTDAWRKQIAGLISENTALRAAAIAEREQEKGVRAKESALLAKRDGELVLANAQVAAYAEDNAGKADLIRKAAWLVGILVLLWIASIVLPIAAKLIPVLSAPAAMISAIVSPMTHRAMVSAQTGLSCVGKALAEVEESLPAAANRVIQIMSEHTDAEHQEVIRAARLNAKP